MPAGFSCSRLIFTIVVIEAVQLLFTMKMITFLVVFKYLLGFVICYLAAGLFFRVWVDLGTVDDSGPPVSEMDKTIVFLVFWPEVIYSLVRRGHWH